MPTAAAVARTETLSVPLVFATWNVHGCESRRGPFDATAIADTLAKLDVDVVALQEVSAHDGAHDHVAEIAALLGMKSVFGPNVVSKAGQYRYGNAILSRWPILESANYDLSVSGVEPRGALVATIESPGSVAIRAASVHFGLRARERAFQAKQLLTRVLDAPSAPPLIIGGDMNDWFAGADTRALRDRLRDAARLATYPAVLPVFRLDHVYVSPHARVTSCRRVRSAAVRGASDHLPLVARVHIPVDVVAVARAS